jgi:hypothetical protein
MESISDFDDIWKNDPDFRKWRGHGEDKLFWDVHHHACHAYCLSYGHSIFERHP